MDVDYELEVVSGNPAHAIASSAEAHDANEIAIGSRGFGRVRSALGSVSRELLHVARRPVTVIPCNSTEGQGGGTGMKVVIAGGGVAALETLLALCDHRERAIARALDRDGAGKRRGRLAPTARTSTS